MESCTVRRVRGEVLAIVLSKAPWQIPYSLEVRGDIERPNEAAETPCVEYGATIPDVVGELENDVPICVSCDKAVGGDDGVRPDRAVESPPRLICSGCLTNVRLLDQSVPEMGVDGTKEVILLQGNYDNQRLW